MAQLLLRNAAPKSQYRLNGISACSFIFWYLCSLAALFSVLLWYFIEGGCSVQLLILPNNLGSDYYSANFNENGRHLCSSKLSHYVYRNGFRRLEERTDEKTIELQASEPTLEPTLSPTTTEENNMQYNSACILEGLTCADYGGLGTSQCDKTPCVERQKCREAKNGQVMVEFSTCIDTPTALMTAIQFTVFAETVVLAIFFIFRLMSKFGFEILFDPRTYFELWNK